MFDEAKLKEIARFWEDDSNWGTEKAEGYLWPTDPWCDSSQKIEGYFWEDLISGNHFNPDGKKALTENGYRVFIGDGDSFGILVACVAKNGRCFSIG